MSDMKARLAKEAARLSAKYGKDTGALASTRFPSKVVPSGVLALDYALGIGGWKLRHPAMIFGAPDIGKSSIIGLAALSNAQKMGLTTGIVALEPGIDDRWLAKNGVDPDLVVVSRPEGGEEAFSILYDWMSGDTVDFVLFDSIGAILRASEQGTDGKPNQGGASSLITWGIKNIVQSCWKNEKGLILINQQREDMKSRIPGQYVPPGGEALKHLCDVIVHLKAGPTKYTVKMDDGVSKNKFDLMVGRQIVAQIKRNKLAEGTNNKAVFDYYQKGSDLHPVGIDVTEDVLNTGIRTGVIEKAGSYLRHPSFPKVGDTPQISGRDSVKEYLRENPEAVASIREGVLRVMKEEVELNV